MTDVYSLSIKADATGVTKAEQALDGLSSGAVKAERSTQEFTKATVRMDEEARRSTGGFRMMKGGIQQVGYQVQDIAVQVGMGVNAFQILGQQGSQVASIFGPGGALMGAVLAIAGAIGGAFFRSTKKATGGAKDLAQEISDLTDKFKTATAAERAYVQTNLAKQIADQTSRIADAKQKLADIAQQINDINQKSQVGVAPKLTPYDAQKLLELRGQQTKLTATIDAANQETAKYQKQIVDLNHNFDDNSKSAKHNKDSIDSLISSLKLQAATVGMTAEQAAIYKAKQDGANQADLTAIRQAYAKINAYKAQQNAMKTAESQMAALAASATSPLDPSNWKKDTSAQDAAKLVAVKSSLDQQYAIQAQYHQRVKALQDAYDKGQIKSKTELNTWMVKAEKDRDNQLLATQHNYSKGKENLDKAILSSSTQFASSIAASVAQMAGKNSNAYRIAFLAQQAFAIATSVINTQMAAAAALAPPPIGLGPIAGAAYAGIIEGLGAANVGVIAAQTLVGIGQSYAQGKAVGGPVQQGQSYLVGERGPEILTMGGQGHITPNDKIGGGGVNQTLVFQVSAGVQGTVRSELQGMMPVIMETAKRHVLNAINSGGPMSQAVNLRS